MVIQDIQSFEERLIERIEIEEDEGILDTLRLKEVVKDVIEEFDEDE